MIFDIYLIDAVQLSDATAAKNIIYNSIREYERNEYLKNRVPRRFTVDLFYLPIASYSTK